MMEQTIAASRCPRCGRMVVPPARLCPDHPVLMEPASVPGVGEVVSFTTLHSPPAPARRQNRRARSAKLMCEK